MIFMTLVNAFILFFTLAALHATVYFGLLNIVNKHIRTKKKVDTSSPAGKGFKNRQTLIMITNLKSTSIPVMLWKREASLLLNSNSKHEVEVFVTDYYNEIELVKKYKEVSHLASDEIIAKVEDMLNKSLQSKLDAKRNAVDEALEAELEHIQKELEVRDSLTP